MKGRKVLIVEDERRIARFLQMELEHEGCTAVVEDNGNRACERLAQEDYDIVLLDVMLPGLDGFSVCRRVREFSQVPIIMLTAKDDIEDKVQGLDIGADDYITKPFATPELLARMRVVLRRQAAGQGSGSGEAGKDSDGEVLSIRSLFMYIARHEVMVGDVPVELTKKEYDLLEYLLRNKRTVLSRNQILSNVWGYDYMGDTNVVDVYIRYLRQKLDDRFGEKYIHTMRGVGYVIKE